jgi:hypothetical protein
MFSNEVRIVKFSWQGGKTELGYYSSHPSIKLEFMDPPYQLSAKDIKNKVSI